MKKKLRVLEGNFFPFSNSLASMVIDRYNKILATQVLTSFHLFIFHLSQESTSHPNLDQLEALDNCRYLQLKPYISLYGPQSKSNNDSADSQVNPPYGNSSYPSLKHLEPSLQLNFTLM